MELVLLIIFFTLIFTFSFYKAKIKGLIGEKTVSAILDLLDKSDYKTINNVLLKTGEVTTQIDHVVISSFGVFVIETKNYKGWIFGYENSEYWTQIIIQKEVLQPYPPKFGTYKNLEDLPEGISWSRIQIDYCFFDKSRSKSRD